MSANEQRRAHYQQEAKAKKIVGTAVHDLAVELGIPRLKPAIVKVIWFVPDKRKRDTDGLGPFLKAAVDGLKDLLWDDDHSDFVVETRMAIDKSDMKNPRIEVLITEVEECQESVPPRLPVNDGDSLSTVLFAFRTTRSDVSSASNRASLSLASWTLPRH